MSHYIQDINPVKSFAQSTLINTRTDRLADASLRKNQTVIGEVIDIILQNTHPSYESPQDIGKCSIKPLFQTSISINIWARPISTQDRTLPVLHEIVTIQYYPSLQGQLNGSLVTPYYSRVINAVGSPSANDMYSISIPKYLLESYTDENPYKLGQTFQKQPINPVKLNQGDRQICGRCGNSIILGTNDGNGVLPFIKIRNKQPNLQDQSQQTQWDHIDADINLDGSSIWQTNNLDIQFTYSCNLQQKYKKVSKFNDNNIFINSDRIIINAKLYDILFTAKQNINIQANKLVQIDSKQVLVSAQGFNVHGATALGSNPNYSMVLGEQLKQVLNDIVSGLSTISQHMSKMNQFISTTFNTHTHPYVLGSPATIVPIVPAVPPIPQFAELKSTIQTIKSDISGILSRINSLE